MTDEIFIDSKELASLRSLLEYQPEFKKLTGEIAQFKIVLDANAAIQDLLHKHRYPERGLTSLEEVTKASAVALYAPTWLDHEMVTSTIPQAAQKRKIPEQELCDLWDDYKQKIIWDNTFSVPDDADEVDGDEKDLPYVLLQKSIGAAGILSEDRDIDKLGGNRVNLQFIIHVRTYARAMTLSVSVQAYGMMFAGLGVGAIVAFFKGVGSLLSRLPDKVQFALLLVGLGVIAHPKSRTWLLDRLRGMGGLFVEAWPEIEKVISQVTEKQIESQSALVEAELLAGMNNEDFWALPVVEAAEIVVEHIEEHGVCWIPLTRAPSERIISETQNLMPGTRLYLSSPPPDWDHVIIDLDRHPTYSQWLKDHASTRYSMKEEGVPDRELPALPDGIAPEGIDYR